MRYVHFKNQDIKTLLNHSRHNERHYPYTDKTAKEMGLMLVKDEGIYLMSSAKKTLSNPNKEDTEGVTHNLVVYADGYEPTEENKDTLWDDTYEFSRDDFAEFIPLTSTQMGLLYEQEVPELVIGLDQDTNEMVISVL